MAIKLKYNEYLDNQKDVFDTNFDLFNIIANISRGIYPMYAL